MSERDAILFANSAFYTAFNMRDAAAMEEVWAKDKPVSCAHPGWAILYGRDDVMKSWRGILKNPNAPKIHCHNERVENLGDVAIVTCIEDLNGRQFLAATNIFARHGSAWHLIHHHAGPANVDPQSLEPSEDETPHGPVN
ncbi:MAG: nuclear transport factor 2 family protein [Rhodospirillaceae bacterium]|nr:nuclear transport factor 2 family protein [Rhodospirillaceae bacterium]